MVHAPAAEPAGAASEPVPPVVPPALAVRWRQGQAALFGSLTMAPEVYEQVVRVLAAVLDRLRERTPTTAALLQVHEAVESWVTELAAVHRLGAVPVDPALVAQAALAVRLPEVSERDAADRRRRMLAAARGSGWVVLEEGGEPTGEPALPYWRLEADPATGRAVLVRSDPDETFTACRHTVTTARVDLATGALLTGRDAATEHADPAARDRRASELRAASPTLANPPDMSDSK